MTNSVLSGAGSPTVYRAVIAFQVQCTRALCTMRRPGVEVCDSRMHACTCCGKLKLGAAPSQVDPSQRLGARGPGDIRAHAWFAGLDWSAMVRLFLLLSATQAAR